MSDLIDKIARDRAEKMAASLRSMQLNVAEAAWLIEGELARAMREAVRLSGGTVPEIQSGQPAKKYDPWASNNNPW